MAEMGAQFDFWGGSVPLGSTKTVPVRQGNETVAPARRKRSRGPQQLSMFMTPEELMKLPQGDQVHYGPGVTDQERRDFWSHKRGDSVLTDAGPYGNGGENLASSIRRQGVQRPVDLEHGPQPFSPWYGHDPTVLVNGAHRVATAADVRPGQLIPVVHHDAAEAPESDEEGHHLRPWARKVPRAMGWRDDR